MTRARLVSAVFLLVTMTLAGMAAETLHGDLDKSGTINAADLVLLANYQAGNLTVIPAQCGQFYSLDSIVGILRRVPAGTFTQGSPETEPCGAPNESEFTHTLTLNLAVMETEVTRQMWADLLAAQPTLPVDPSDTAYSPTMDCPANRVTWYEALLFANLLSLQQGLVRCYYTDAGFTSPITSGNYTSGPFFCKWDASGYRLACEGEWERFCRAGTTTPFSIAEPNYSSENCATCSPSPSLNGLDGVAWWCRNSGSVAHPVGTKSANPWNLKDVHGNVLEWCWDRFADYPTAAQTDYRGSTTATTRAIRGGSFPDYAVYCRSAVRVSHPPGDYYPFLGFRLVRSLP